MHGKRDAAVKLKKLRGNAGKFPYCRGFHRVCDDRLIAVQQFADTLFFICFHRLFNPPVKPENPFSGADAIVSASTRNVWDLPTIFSRSTRSSSGITAASGLYSYQTMRGAAFKSLLDLGVDHGLTDDQVRIVCTLGERTLQVDDIIECYMVEQIPAK